MTEWIGWLATLVFAMSYACRSPEALRRVQAVAASVWIVYGISLGAVPVIVANVVVAGVAVLSSLRRASS
jgi:hypothetical protein